MLADTNSADYVWSDAELNRYIQDGYDLFCRAALAIFDRQAIPDVAGEAVYDLPVGITELDRVTWNNYRIRSDPQDAWTSGDPVFESQQGQVEGYLVDGDGFGKIRKIRVPAGDDATKFMVEFYRIGAELTADTDRLEIPTWDSRAIRHYVLAQAYGRDGKGKNLEASTHYLARWVETLERARSRNYKVQARRTVVIGGTGEVRTTGRPPRPRLPWQYGTVVRGRR